MLNKIKLRNFKCFEKLSLPLGSLTLMTGFNASGKSTVLQSILLIMQTLRSDFHANSVNLNGPFVKLGTPGEVLRESSDIEGIFIGFSSEKAELGWLLSFPEADSLKHKNFLKVHSVLKEKAFKKITEKTKLHNLLPKDDHDKNYTDIISSLKNAIFISAVRKVELDSFPSPEEVPIPGDVGVYGEYAPWFFQEYSDDTIPEIKRHPSAKEEVTLRTQYSAWGSSIFPGTEGNASKLGSRSNLIELGLRVNQGDYRRPSNIGYGISYVFPILIAGLQAQPGQLLIIDSPEAHLHPRGQSQMGRFLAHMAQAGVQVIVETHSDHLLNGVRLAVKEKTLSNEKVAIHFFRSADPIEGTGPAKVISPVLDQQGSLDSWPDGFFDQSEKDLAGLMDWKD